MRFTALWKIGLVGLAIPAALAHPGEHEKYDARAELQKRQFKQNVRRGLERCAKRFEASGLNARAEARRRDLYNMHRRHVKARDTSDVLSTSHLVDDSSITSSTSADSLFSTSSTCVLNPEGETGPYYVKGELIRSDIQEDEDGVPVIFDIQFVDVDTCEAIEDLYADVWSCNATGVYSGVVATGNGNTADTSNLDATFLRGIQATDSDGVVSFSTLFPGHYSGRTTHHHIVAHLDVTVLSNGTISGGTVAHIGQLFWDQDLIDEVEATSPYSTNTVTLTTNAEDRVFSDETEDSTSDPVLNYVWLGDSLSDGLLGWTTVAVDTSATYDPNYSFVYTSSGGVAESGGGSDTSSSGSGSSGSGSSGSGGSGGSSGPGGSSGSPFA
ncbi:aromatic compound dioxygenase [Penicillium macrosclerotiorum]|uniref:aromatic compound dioxygenase n=1 Tax=Penicillium macrosclerotiorum TaxID=303699 RepID=UPI0025497389|nr:aromatic compound dioxygenase [Penicillium macrosclerotiorum]KAJ5690048.1 aromatic compound dioxygenase [Penicillium macrosclerotiorum]